MVLFNGWDKPYRGSVSNVEQLATALVCAIFVGSFFGQNIISDFDFISIHDARIANMPDVSTKI